MGTCPNVKDADHRGDKCSICRPRGNIGIGMLLACLLGFAYVWSWTFAAFVFAVMFLFFVRPIWWPPLPHEEMSERDKDRWETLCFTCFGGWQTTWVLALMLTAHGAMPAFHVSSLLKGALYGVLAHTKIKLKPSRIEVETKATPTDVAAVLLIEVVPTFVTPWLMA